MWLITGDNIDPSNRSTIMPATRPLLINSSTITMAVQLTFKPEQLWKKKSIAMYESPKN